MMVLGILLTIVIVAGAIISSLLYSSKVQGCNGNCNQGRLPCDCRGKE